MRSPLARVPKGHDPRRGLRRLRVETTRYVVHQTGAGIVARALRGNGTGTPAEVVDRTALEYYTSKRLSAHYYIGLGGAIWHLTHEAVRAPHVGVTVDERQAYRSGRWAHGERPEAPGTRPVTPAVVALWRRDWPRYEGPHELTPLAPNDCAIGSEMAPAGHYIGGVWAPLPGVVPWLTTRHTLAQHLAVAALAADIARRYHWPRGWATDPRGGPRSPWLLGHEDLDLFGRADAAGGWDPGALREDRRWDWQIVRGAISGLLAGGALADFVCRAIGLRARPDA